MENNVEMQNGINQDKFLHLPFLTVLLQSLGFQIGSVEFLDPAEIRNFADGSRGTNIVITCGYSGQRCCLRLPEKPAACDCLKIDKEYSLEAFSKSGNVKTFLVKDANNTLPCLPFNSDESILSTRKIFQVLLEKARKDFVKSAREMQDIFSYDPQAVTSTFLNILTENKDQPVDESGFDASLSSSILNETFIVFPKQKAYSVSQHARNVRRSISDSTNSKKITKTAKSDNKIVEPQTSLDTNPLSKLKPTSFITSTPVTKSSANKKLNVPSINVKRISLSSPSSLRNNPPTGVMNDDDGKVVSKLKVLGTAIRNSTSNLRRSIASTSKQTSKIKADNKIQKVPSMSNIPTSVRKDKQNEECVQTLNKKSNRLDVNLKPRANSTGRYSFK